MFSSFKILVTGFSIESRKWVQKNKFIWQKSISIFPDLRQEAGQGDPPEVLWGEVLDLFLFISFTFPSFPLQQIFVRQIVIRLTLLKMEMLKWSNSLYLLIFLLHTYSLCSPVPLCAREADLNGPRHLPSLASGDPLMEGTSSRWEWEDSA